MKIPGKFGFIKYEETDVPIIIINWEIDIEEGAVTCVVDEDVDFSAKPSDGFIQLLDENTNVIYESIIHRQYEKDRDPTTHKITFWLEYHPTEKYIEYIRNYVKTRGLGVREGKSGWVRDFKEIWDRQ
jgi:hypothetical protein